MKNPFVFNFVLLGTIVVCLGLILFCSCCYCGQYCFEFKPRTENILLGIFSSAILLLIVELINYIIDRRKYGFIKGRYYRKAIFQINENRVRGSEIPENVVNVDERRRIRTSFQETKGELYSNDSIYHELIYQKCLETKYAILLNYQFHGIYSGTVEYMFHDDYDGRWHDRNIKKTKAVITLNLNLANKMTGSGTYKYLNKDDFGKYEFQIDDENPNRIIVSYWNTVPSGLAEGYEIWEKE